MAENRHLQSYKNVSKSVAEMRSRRHETTIELRKAKKEEQMFKRRNIDVNATSPLKENNQNAPSSPTLYSSLEEIVLYMQSNDEDTILRATQAARKMLSQERNPPIETLIGHGIVPLCVRFLDSNNEDLQFEAAWALTNIASGTSEQTMTVVKANAIPKFIELLQSDAIIVAEQSVWALGNIAGDGPITRDIVLKHNAVEAILRLFHKDQPLSFLRNIVWLMSNLCRNKNPGPPFEKVQMMLPILSQLLTHTDVQILTDASWAISYVTDDESDRIQAVIDAGCVPHLVRLLGMDDNLVIVPALRSVGNIVTGNDSQTDVVLEAGGMMYMKKLLNNNRQNIVKEAAWTVSNITAGNPQQIQKIIDAGIFEEICRVLSSSDFRTQKEAAWVITNTSSSGTAQQVVYLLERIGILNPFCALLTSTDPRTVLVVLTGLKNLFQLADKLNGVESLANAVEVNGALANIEALQSHENQEIYKIAYELIETYFGEGNEEQKELSPGSDGVTLEFNSNHGPNGGFPPKGGFSF